MIRLLISLFTAFKSLTLIFDLLVGYVTRPRPLKWQFIYFASSCHDDPPIRSNLKHAAWNT